jgi:hypothetical protein
VQQAVAEKGRAGPEGDTRRVLVHAGWRDSRKRRREVLTAKFACAAGRMDAPPHRFYGRPLGSGWSTAGEGRRRAGEG